MLITDEEMKIQYYNYLDAEGTKKNYPFWRGIQIKKFPQDLVLYAQAIFKAKPDWIVETGTWLGGSASFFGDMIMLSSGKGVITIDVHDKHQPPHPFVEYIKGSSIDLNLFRALRRRLKDKGSVMVILDSDHSTKHVARELELYSQIVSPGQYMVVEDCYTRRQQPYFPYPAVQEFVGKAANFKLHTPEDQFVFAVSRGGWLMREA
jgi:cephalosporin hydroxylase